MNDKRSQKRNTSGKGYKLLLLDKNMQKANFWRVLQVDVVRKQKPVDVTILQVGEKQSLLNDTCNNIITNC